MKKKYLLCFFFYLNSAFSVASTTSERLEQQLTNIKTLSANFKQTLSDGKKIIQTTTGKLYIKRPGRFRWLAIEPFEQLVVADGKNLWVFDKDLEQVTVSPQEKGLGDTPAMFLSAYDLNLTQRYQVSQNTKKGITYYRLKALKTENNFNTILLGFNKAKLVYVELHDSLGQISKLYLSNIKINEPLTVKLFQFEPPSGVDIIKQSR